MKCVDLMYSHCKISKISLSTINLYDIQLLMLYHIQTLFEIHTYIILHWTLNNNNKNEEEKKTVKAHNVMANHNVVQCLNICYLPVTTVAFIFSYET